MKPEVYYLLHVIAGFLLAGWTFQAFADPSPKNKRRISILTGIAAAVMFVAGFGLQAKLKTGFPLWLIVKMVCWLILAVLPVVAFRKPAQVKGLSLVAIVVTATAIAMVYLKPL